MRPSRHFLPVLALVGVAAAAAAQTRAPLAGQGTLRSSPTVAAPTVAATATGASKASPAALPTRIFSRGQTTWVWAQPKKSRNGIGYVRLGQSIALRGEEAVRGVGCPGLFYPVEPYGWVCLDRTATLDGDRRWQRAMQLARPRNALMPFDYALSNGAPMYRRLPTVAEREKERAMFGEAGKFKPQSWGNRGHEKLAEVRAVAPTATTPWFLTEGGSASREKPLALLRRQIPHGSMLSYTSAFEHEGRTYLLSADGTVVPADRARPFRVSRFHGVTVGKDADLPLAFMRKKARPKFVRSESGAQATGATWPVRSWVAIDASGEVIETGKRRFLPTKERDERGNVVFIDESDATVITQRERAPIGVSDGVKWIVFSITQGTLVAYEGSRAVYATLASPGAGGVPVKGKNPVKMSTTPLGVYRVTFKHRATTMSPEYGENRSFWIADVPYTQYFNAPFALHTAYWHEDFGEPMSAGCVNLSPLDGKWLFEWTDPNVPEGWAGAGPGGPHGPGTFVVVTR